ncbi:amidophosphoribosyltransferase [Magnetofaba australis]|uniref:Amidophosphoribosyltransferase n=1 Tax=Magnetofaba australis IT-1 TaxID=1434232 RepID=A0A1Y2K085_9PROT|nr:amidophosphoribosyltransferase [Magnetofaba australis]OSM01441.1 putative amidophosphoribosyltransferase [Magnetofaba australis IT-1]
MEPLLDDDHFHDECGVFGVYNHSEAANLVYLGLYALQHRGQEAAGIVSVDDRIFHVSRGSGLVADIFKAREMERLKGRQSIGHVRYSTAGGSINVRNRQPLVVDSADGGLAFAHNGNLVNGVEMRRMLERRGSIFQSTMDTEVIVHLTALSRKQTFPERLVEALKQVRGAYALTAMDENLIIGVRDPSGFRPLCLGKIGDDCWILSSETCALDLIEAEFVRDVEPGEMVVIGPNGLESYFPFEKKARSLCVFEFIYFARPDSTIDGISVYEARKRIGAALARENPVEADVVVPVPDSGVAAAMGYAQESGIPFELGIIRNHYVGRTFIEPEQKIRHFGVKIKLNANPMALKGKRVILVDDSVVRGTTSRKIVKMVRAAGAKEVHMRISSPPTAYPCYYGIDTPTRAELLASSHSVEEMCQHITADSLQFITLPGLYQAVNGGPPESFCDACFSGDYPIPFSAHDEGGQLTLLQEA